MNVTEYLSTFYKGTKNPTLDAMQYFMNEFHHPERNMKIIHIAGTNGKGSCTEMMNQILICAGYQVGKFISPHLIKYNERISIQNKNITDKQMEELIKQIQPKIEKYEKITNKKITLFELETTMALLYFYQNSCDFVVLETGLGGLYDCTNVVNPLVSIITSIGYDHMHILGNTLAEIATQKAGIIKPNSHAIWIEQTQGDVNQILEQTCREKHAKPHKIRKEEIKNYSYDTNFQKFDYKQYHDVLINLKGVKQIENASICLTCVDILKEKNYPIPEEAVRQGLKTVVHKGRFEKIFENPTIIYDGGHNTPAIQNLKNSINMYHKNDKKVYIISILKNKDYHTVLKELLEDNQSTFIFTSGNDEMRYVSKEELLETAKGYTSNEKLYAKELKDAIDLVKNQYTDCVTFIIGSFYIYGSVMGEIWRRSLKFGDGH